MLGKKQSLDEKMAHSIHYNLSILKHAVKTTPEFDDIFSTVRNSLMYSWDIIINLISSRPCS